MCRTLYNIDDALFLLYPLQPAQAENPDLSPTVTYRSAILAHPPNALDKPPEQTLKRLKQRRGQRRFALYLKDGNDGLDLVDLREFSASIKNPKDPNRNRGES